jgi:hypothetical protein
MDKRVCFTWFVAIVLDDRVQGQFGKLGNFPRDGSGI